MPSRPRARSDRSRARACGATGIALTLLALLVGVRPLLALGCALLCLALAVVLWVSAGVRWVAVSRRLVEDRVVEGELMEAVITVRGRHALVFGVRIADPFTGAVLPVRGQGWMPAPAGRRTRQLVATAGRRGRHTYGPPAVVLDDPLGLAFASGPVRGRADEVLVLPRVAAVEWSTQGWQAVRGEHDSGQAIFGAGEVDGIREYQPGTPATRIHWPSLARGAGLFERRVVAASETRPTLVLDARTQKSAAGAELLDAAVRAAASLIVELARHGGCAVLLPDTRMPCVIGHNLQGWGALHTRLALVEPEWYAGPAPALRRETLRGPLVYVSSGTVSLPSLTEITPSAVIHVQPLTEADPQERRLFTVAGCGGFAVRERTERAAATVRGRQRRATAGMS